MPGYQCTSTKSAAGNNPGLLPAPATGPGILTIPPAFLRVNNPATSPSITLGYLPADIECLILSNPPPSVRSRDITANGRNKNGPVIPALNGNRLQTAVPGVYNGPSLRPVCFVCRGPLLSLCTVEPRRSNTPDATAPRPVGRHHDKPYPCPGASQLDAVPVLIPVAGGSTGRYYTPIPMKLYR